MCQQLWERVRKPEKMKGNRRGRESWDEDIKSEWRLGEAPKINGCHSGNRWTVDTPTEAFPSLWVSFLSSFLDLGALRPTQQVSLKPVKQSSGCTQALWAEASLPTSGYLEASGGLKAIANFWRTSLVCRPKCTIILAPSCCAHGCFSPPLERTVRPPQTAERWCSAGRFSL